MEGLYRSPTGIARTADRTFETRCAVVRWRGMRRLSRILLNSQTILSLLLCLATAALWARSYWHWDYLSWGQRARPGAESFFFILRSGSGGVGIVVGYY